MGFPQQPRQRTEATVSVLSEHSLMTISGPDSQRFLQGQISTHMNQLLPKQHSGGVACTPKGRMYSTFRIVNDGSQYLLYMGSDLIEPTLETLKKYSVFFKTTLEPSQNHILLGLSGTDIGTRIMDTFSLEQLPRDNTLQAIEDDCLLMDIPGIMPRYLLLLPEQKLSQWWPELTSRLTPATEAFWKLLNIESVTPELSASLTEKYIPQHLNQPSLGNVSFKKGCFTGQEIITRMQNLGQQKSRCYHLTLKDETVPDVNQRIYDQDGKNAGEVIMATKGVEGSQVDMLAVVRIDSAETSHLYLDQDGNQPLEVHPIPYPVDEKAELQH